jgi:hypothetical protein
VRAWLLAVVVSVGCAESAAVVCDDGTICPANTLCDRIHGGCLLPNQLETCVGLVDGTDCPVGASDGVCRDEVCLLAGCGDTFVKGAEQCDTTLPDDKDECSEHGFQNVGTVTCSDECTYDTSACTGYCGDGTVNGDEQCDPMETTLGGFDCEDFGYYVETTGLACSPACTYDLSGCDERCGDDVRNGSEACDGPDLGGLDCTDLGYYVSTTLSCTAGCSFDTSECQGYCGDHALTSTRELCDGKAPFLETCTTYGFEVGTLGCSGVCAPDFSLCRSPFRVPWTDMPSGTTAEFRDAWGTGADNIWAVGCVGAGPCVGSISHYAGVSWSTTATMGTPELRAIWGSDANNIFVVGNNSTVMHYTGTWAVITPPGGLGGEDFVDVWGTSATDVFIVGNSGSILHWSGSGWDPTYTAPGGSLNAIWGTSASNVYAVGLGGRIYSYNGTWSPMTSNSTDNLVSIWGSSSKDIYVGGSTGTILQYTGVWAPMPTSTTQGFYALWGSGPGDIYAVGSMDTIRHFDGVGWRVMDPVTTSQTFRAVWGVAGDVFAFGTGGVIRRFNGEGWAPRATGTFIQPLGVWSNGPTTATIVGGTKIIDLPTRVTTIGDSLTAVAGNAMQVFAVGQGGVIWERDAALTWTKYSSSPATTVLRAVTSPAPDVAFAVGNNGVVVQRIGTTWSTLASGTTANLSGVWASSATDVFVIGFQAGASLVRHYDGNNWTQMTIPTNDILYGIWGTGPRDVFVVGDDSTLLHYNGSTWTQQDSPVQTRFWAVGGTGPGDVYASGDDGIVLHYDGYGWGGTTTNTTEPFYGVSGTFAVPFNGSILDWRRKCDTTEDVCDDGKDNDCDGIYDCGDANCANAAECQAGGACPNAITITCGSTAIGDTTTGTNRNSRYACDPFVEHGKELVYAVTVPSAGSVTATVMSQHDHDLVVLAEGPGGTCEPRNPGCVGASSTTNGTETVTFTAAAGATYYLVVDGYGASAGEFDLAVTCN